MYSTRYDNIDRGVLVPSTLVITHINADQLSCTCNGSTKRLEQVVMKLLHTGSSIKPDYGETRLSYSTFSRDEPEPHSHGLYHTANAHIK